MASVHEYESESEQEAALEGEEFLGGIGKALGGLLGESEDEVGELEDELGELGELEGELGEVGELEDELGELEGELGEVGELEDELGELEGELGEVGELEDELGELGEFEQGEQFFGKIARGIGRFAKRAAPFLKKIAKVAAPIVGTAIGGPLGGKLASVASKALLSEHELGELEGEFELGEHEMEVAEHEAAPQSMHELNGELMAAVAANAETELEAEAMAGAATAASISSKDRAALRGVLPHMVRGTAILTRLLRSRRATRPAVRAVPTIVRRTKRVLARQAARGRPITRRTAARVMAGQTRKVLGSPRLCARAMMTNAKSVRTARRLNRRAGAGSRRSAEF